MIRHILKDGRAVEDIAGRVLSSEEFPLLYGMLAKLRDETKREKTNRIGTRSGQDRNKKGRFSE